MQSSINYITDKVNKSVEILRSQSPFFLWRLKVCFYEVSEQWEMIKVFFSCQTVFILTRDWKILSSIAKSISERIKLICDLDQRYCKTLYGFSNIVKVLLVELYFILLTKGWAVNPVSQCTDHIIQLPLILLQIQACFFLGLSSLISSNKQHVSFKPIVVIKETIVVIAD